MIELQNHVKSFGTKSKKKQKLEDEKSHKEEVKNNVEGTKDKKNTLKKVFPDTLEKTEKQIEALQTKISKLEFKMKTRVIESLNFKNRKI